MKSLGWSELANEGWVSLPVRSAFFPQHEKHGSVSGEYLSLMAGTGVIPYAEKGDIGNKAPEDMSKCKRVAKGDFVINSMNFGIGSFGVSNYDGICSPVYLVLKPNDQMFNTSFVSYIFQMKQFQQYAQSFGNGILAHRAAVGWDELKNIALPVPPIDEQKAIADFLDRELAQIDALITKQELFEIVSRQRINSSILSAITGDGALALDPSSSEIWSGDLPSGWSVRKLSHLFGSIGSGTTPTSDSAEYYGGTVPWVTTGELRETTILETSRYVTEKAMKDFSALKLHPQGSLVIAMYGATVGRLGFLGMDATVNQACCVMSKPLGVDIEYVYFALQGLREVLVSLATGGGQPNISQGLLKSFMIPVPPHQNQIEIRELLEIEMKQHNALQETNGRILATLRERRQSLISAAVTGKIDVRKAA